MTIIFPFSSISLTVESAFAPLTLYTKHLSHGLVERMKTATQSSRRLLFSKGCPAFYSRSKGVKITAANESKISKDAQSKNLEPYKNPKVS